MEYKERIAPNYYALFFETPEGLRFEIFHYAQTCADFSGLLNEGVLTKKDKSFSDSNRVDSMNGKGFVFFLV